MEGVTNEIRNKIKCAVKAKLQEIGAYVDEELPDYIMVMIANRRSKTQMTSELSLFLGSHTDKFTDWLHVVLEKLEAYVVSTNVDKNKESISNPSKPESDLFTLPTNVQEASTAVIHPHSGLLTEKITQSKTNVVTQTTLTNLESQDCYVPTPVSTPVFINPHPSKLQQPVEDMDDDCLNIREEIEQEFHAEDKLPKKNLSSTAYQSSFSDHKRRRHTRSADSRDTKKFRREERSRPRRTDGRISSQVVSVVKPLLSQVVKPVERNRTKVENNGHEENSLNNKNGVNSIVRVTARRRLPAKMQATNSLILKAVAEAQKSVITCPPKVVEPESKPLPALFTRKYREKNLNTETVAVTISNSNIKQVTDEPDMEIDDEQLVGKEVYRVEAERPDFIHTAIEGPQESSGVSKERSESPIYSHVIDQTVETRFIVTLDGAHPQMSRCFDEDLNDEDETEMTELDDTGRKPLKSRLFRRRSTGTEAEVQQTLERCKFWPNCRQGTRCNFHHPKTVCKNFPNCLFGENCLFIHPQCKFDTTCTRKSCPYTHSLRPKVVVPVTPMAIPVMLHPQPLSVVNGKTVCKFFPACNNVSCVFFHPPACKYGSNCTRVGCTFSHPNSTPSTNKLKWVTSTK